MNEHAEGYVDYPALISETVGVPAANIGVVHGHNTLIIVTDQPLGFTTSQRAAIRHRIKHDVGSDAIVAFLTTSRMS